MSWINRTGSAPVGTLVGALGLALVLLTLSGCIQAQRKGPQSDLMEAQSIRTEVMSHPQADQVREELNQSARYQEKAEAYMAKSRASSSVELKGVRKKYTEWADQMAKLSLDKAREAQDKLQGKGREGAETASQEGAKEQEMSSQTREEDSQGPPGPLSGSQDEEAGPDRPLGQEPVQEPIKEETMAQAAPRKPQGGAAEGALVNPRREGLQGSQGPLKEDFEEQMPTPSEQAQEPPVRQPAGQAQAGTAPEEEAPPQMTASARAGADRPLEPPENEPPAEPQELYNRAMALYRDGNFGGSRRLFLAFLAQHPKHNLADNSQYWIGETYYDEAEYVLALGAFEAVVRQYPKGSKVPDGLVKMGLSELKLGRVGQGRKALEECLAKYPKSPAAEVARRYLNKLAE